jgi:Fanconi anemia group I protein
MLVGIKTLQVLLFVFHSGGAQSRKPDMNFFETTFAKFLTKKLMKEAKSTSQLLVLLKPHVCEDVQALKKHIQWSESICRDNQVTDATLACQMTQFHLQLTADDTELRTLHLLAHDLRSSLGLINEDAGGSVEEPAGQDGLLALVHKTWAPVTSMALTWLDERFNDAEWLILQLKVLHGALAAIEDDSASFGDLEAPVDGGVSLAQNHRSSITKLCVVADELYSRLYGALRVLLSISKCSISAGPAAESLLRCLSHAFKLLVASCRLVQTTKRHPSKKFIRLIEFAGTKFTPPLYGLLTHLQNTEAMDDVEQTTKTKIIRESKLIPSLIFNIETFDLAVIRLDKLCKSDLTKFLRRATARDFKIDDKLVKADPVKKKPEGSKKATVKRKQKVKEEDDDDEAEEDVGDEDETQWPDAAAASPKKHKINR